MSVRYTSNMGGYNGMLPQYTIANKVSRQLRHSLQSLTKVVCKVVQLNVVYFNYVKKDAPPPPPLLIQWDITEQFCTQAVMSLFNIGRGWVGVRRKEEVKCSINELK